MINQKYISLIASETTIREKQIISVSSLMDEGSTIPFISRYRKEATGNLDEVQIALVADKIQYFNELEKRKQTILKSIEEQGKLSPELQAKITNCLLANELEDIYLPYKPKRKTRASVAIEKGLEPLAHLIFELQDIDPEAEAMKYITADVTSVNEAIQGAQDIIAEWITEHELARKEIRHLFSQEATLVAKVMSSKKDTEDAQKYRDYFDFSESLSKCPSHRLLAIRRAEKEGFISMDISVLVDTAVESLYRLFITRHNAASKIVKDSIDDAYQRLLKPSIETEFRLSSKQTADEEAILVFAENLRQLLLASPLGQKRVLAIDPGFRTGCKVVCLDEYGAFLHYQTIFPHAPQNQWTQAQEELYHLIDKYQIEAIGYGNGTASKETENLARSLKTDKPLSIFMVNESGASIYSASPVAREEFPDQDVTVRGAISIGRRLLDPLSELVKIEPKSIGVGQYQHDVNQPKLKSQLDQVVESCVNYVGVNVNTASKHLLMYVAGLTQTTAQNIVNHRISNGAFTSRQQLLAVPHLGPKAYEQCAGFLRISNPENPLDNSAVHPESYHVVEQMAGNLHCTIQDLLHSPDKIKSIKAKEYITEKAGEYTINDIIKELEKPGRDPREPIEEFSFAEGVSTLDDLKIGMQLPGIITNITKFGAFVNVGVKQDGMVHISQMSDTYITDPNQVVKLGQKVQATVLEVDMDRGRVSLSLKGERKQKSPATKKINPPKNDTANDFQSKLEALKNKMNKS